MKAAASLHLSVSRIFKCDPDATQMPPHGSARSPRMWWEFRNFQAAEWTPGFTTDTRSTGA